MCRPSRFQNHLHLGFYFSLTHQNFKIECPPEDVLEDDEEVLQGDVVRLELAAELEAGVDDLLDDQLHDAHQVAALDHHRVPI